MGETTRIGKVCSRRNTSKYDMPIDQDIGITEKNRELHIASVKVHKLNWKSRTNLSKNSRQKK